MKPPAESLSNRFQWDSNHNQARGAMHMFQGVLSLALTRLAEGGIPWSNGNGPYQVRRKLRGGTSFSRKFRDKNKFATDSIVSDNCW